jgi:hypothetical protein
VQDAKHLPESVAKIHRDAQDQHRRDPSAGSAESWRAPYQEQAEGTQRRDREYHDPHRLIVPLQEASLTIPAVAAVTVSRIQGMLTAPAMLGVVHEAYPEVRSQIYRLVMFLTKQNRD